jgi:hypothetical protein
VLVQGGPFVDRFLQGGAFFQGSLRRLLVGPEILGGDFLVEKGDLFLQTLQVKGTSEGGPSGKSGFDYGLSGRRS